MEQFTVLLDKKRKYGDTLPCPQCGTSLLHNCMKNAVRFVTGNPLNPQRIWNADLYHCPKCRSLVLTDFGRVSQWNRQNTPFLGGQLDELIRSGDVVVYQSQFKDNSSISAILPDDLIARIAMTLRNQATAEAMFDRLAKNGRAA